MTLAVQLLAASASFASQVALVIISGVTTGSFVLAAAIITGRSHNRMSESISETRDAVGDVKKKIDADKRESDS